MFRNYLKTACNVLGRRKFFTFVSLFGIGFTLMVLTIAVGALDVIVSPGAPEVHLDRTLFFNRAIMRGGGTRGVEWWSAPGYRLLDHYLRDIPGVERFSITSEPVPAVAFVQGKKLQPHLRFADAAFWEIHSFTFLEGGPFSAEDDRAGNLVAVINADTRKRFFGGRAALGQVVELNQLRYRVVGVVADVAYHRAGAFSSVWVPLGTFPNREAMDNLMGGFMAILLARSRADFPRIREEFQARLDRVEFPQPERFSQMVGRLTTHWDDYLSNIAGVDENGELQIAHRLPALLGVAAAFMLLPVINLISVNMSRIFERTSEIGVRKAFGASSLHLLGQFVMENIVLCVIGGVLGLLGGFAVIGVINASGVIPQASLHFNYRVFGYALLLAGFFGVLSGAYPAWRMSRIHPVEALRGGIR